MKMLRLLAVVCFSLVSGTALANPIATIMRLSAEVTGSTHVRLRYLTNVGSNPSLATHGTSRSDWFTNGDTTSVDAGSGARTMTYQYMCDCHVPTGSALTYQVTGSATAGFSPSYPAQLTATVTPTPNATTLCDEKCAEADSRDAGTGGSTGGATSSASSAAGGSTTSITSTAEGGSTADVASTASTGSASEEKSGGACAFSSRGRTGALSLLLALGLMALSWRRRR